MLCLLFSGDEVSAIVCDRDFSFLFFLDLCLYDVMRGCCLGEDTHDDYDLIAMVIYAFRLHEAHLSAD